MNDFWNGLTKMQRGLVIALAIWGALGGAFSGGAVIVNDSPRVVRIEVLGGATIGAVIGSLILGTVGLTFVLLIGVIRGK